MAVGTLIWIIIGAIILLDLLICCIYSRFRKCHDKKKINISTDKDIVLTDTPKSGLRRLIRRIDSAVYGLCRYTSICIGRFPSHILRRLLFKYIFCMKVNRHAIIHGGCEIRSPWNVTIGNSVIGVGTILDGRNGIEIEDDVVLATGVWIWTEQHDAEDPYFRCLNKGGKVVIKRHVWIGNRVSILPKVVIEEGSVIASGAVVTKSCSPFRMYGGIPAKEIHERNNDLRYTNVTDGIWWFY